MAAAAVRGPGAVAEQDEAVAAEWREQTLANTHRRARSSGSDGAATTRMKATRLAAAMKYVGRKWGNRVAVRGESTPLGV
jgi:hypothetical protein